MPLPFRQVDVFSPEPLLGNPVAVVHEADGLTDQQMAAFARWTNLSETTFLLRPTDPGADYRVRIFTPGEELPFAGHPTLGSAHAWLEAGGTPRGAHVVQQCGLGLVRVARSERLAFAAPDLLRDGPVDDDLLDRLTDALGITGSDVLAARWCDNGPGWVGLLLRDADAVLAVRPAFARLPAPVGIAGRHPGGGPADIEVRALCPGHMGVDEDPVTGSLNAALAQWLTGDGTLPGSYVAAQGQVLGRAGRVHVDTADDGTIWVGGDTVTTVSGTVGL